MPFRAAELEAKILEMMDASDGNGNGASVKLARKDFQSGPRGPLVSRAAATTASSPRSSCCCPSWA